MKVSNEIENLPQVSQSQTVASAPSAKTGVQAQVNTQNESLNRDKAQLSVTASQAAQSSSTSDVRFDKVASIQNALQAGTYFVPASAVAERVISSLLSPEN
jgi:flagellar biosynthesis anti-sigma factor FlgM